MRFLSDNARHLICMPYSIDGLHRMAECLGIKRCWFHVGRFPHFDIPKRRIRQIQSLTTVVSTKQLHKIIRQALDNAKI